MKIKYMIIFVVFGLILTFCINNSFALDEEMIEKLNNVETENLNITLENIEDTEEVYKFIDLIDNSLIPTATFDMSDTLNDNYDFLTIFAINFILNNEEYYKDNIIQKENYIYNDTYITNKYIDINNIYDITYNILGKKNYYIINEYLEVENNLIPLLLIEEYSFMMELDKIENIVKFANNYEVSVKYKNIDLTYKYIFEKMDNIYIINNIQVY